jgi:plasmid stabilization system protein ParE
VAKIRWSSEANLWLQDIFSYIAKDNPVAAERVVQGIYNQAQVLESFPEMGYKYKHDSESKIRVLLYGHYRIAYLINEDFIDILGVFHGALKIERFLDK